MYLQLYYLLDDNICQLYQLYLQCCMWTGNLSHQHGSFHLSAERSDRLEDRRIEFKHVQKKLSRVFGYLIGTECSIQNLESVALLQLHK